MLSMPRRTQERLHEPFGVLRFAESNAVSACVPGFSVLCVCVWLSTRSHTQDWSHELFGTLRDAGGTAYSNYAVGYNNVHVPAATENRIAVGNTPGAYSIP